MVARPGASLSRVPGNDIVPRAPVIAAFAFVCAMNASLVAAADPQFGVRLREQIESFSDDTLGRGARHDTVAQHRVLADADWQARPSLHAFVQLGAFAQNGRNGGASPVDQSAPDLQQGFVQWRTPDARYELRAGRQEWVLGSGRLVSVRDGPNIRRAFDGAQLQARFGAIEALAFAGRPVRNLDTHWFDDRRDDGQHLAGVQLTLRPLPPLRMALYGLDYGRRDARFAEEIDEDEERRSWGLRLDGAAGAWDFNSELVWQTGHWGRRRIRAWTIANDFGFTMRALAATPRVGLKADIASGDRDADDDRLETFNALYPNPSYFSDAALISPANLVDLQPNMSWSWPGSGRSLYVGWNLLWKQRGDDAVYTTPVPLTAVEGSAGRGGFVGHQVQISGAQDFGEHLRIEASAVRFDPGRALSHAQNGTIEFLQLVITLRY